MLIASEGVEPTTLQCFVYNPVRGRAKYVSKPSISADTDSAHEVVACGGRSDLFLNDIACYMGEKFTVCAVQLLHCSLEKHTADS